MKYIVDEKTTIGNLYKGTDLEYLTDILYYGWIRNYPGNANAVISEMCKDIWDNEETIRDLNLIYDMHQKGEYETIFLNKDKPDVCLMYFKHPNVTSKTAIVIAGGGYNSVATAVESLPAAMYLYEKKGMNVFCLNYSIYPDVLYTSPMDDLACAVKYIKEHQKELNVIIDDYMVIGFSAGGHLAASWGTGNHGYKQYGLPRPGIIGLAYPVITFTSATHGGTRRSCIGDNPSQELIDEYSIEKNVTSDYPKTYIWACENDPAVPFVSNTLKMAETLKENRVPHIFKPVQGDAHGWGLGRNKPIAGWVDELYDFWQE